jgi:isoquinoline 1-oxidoreductase beta subunit
MNDMMKVSRRDFMKTAAVTSGGLVIGLHIPTGGIFSKVAKAAMGAELNAWVHIAADNTITMRLSQTELGQGTAMGNLMMFAEEMECNWADVTFDQDASGRPEYVNPLVGLQLTGGSTATPGFWDVMRKAGAQTRHMLIQAAAKQWGVDPAECTAKNSMVTHKGPGAEGAGVEKSATFGELAEAAAGETPPEEPVLKSPDEFHLIGTHVDRLDNHMKITGSCVYGLDTVVDGMVIAAIRHAPFGGSIAGYDEAAAKAMPGVHDVVVVGAEAPAVFLDNNRPALLVTADTYWQAEQGMKAANPTFNHNGHENLSSAEISKTLMDGLEEDGKLGRVDGDVNSAMDSAASIVEATYETPYISHAAMEVQNAIADVRADSVEIWAPTQTPGGAFPIVEMITGIPVDKTTIHVTMVGGGFGRRNEFDAIEQAVEASLRLKKIVKVVWSREEDLQHHPMRPTYAAKMTAGLDANGEVVAWKHKTAGPGIWLSPHRSSRLKNLFAGSDFMNGMQESGVDFHAVQGAKDIGYDFANLEVAWVQKDFHVPIIFFRGVGNTTNAFFIESFLDEICAANGQDPLALRQKLLAKEPRMLAVLNLAAEKAGWGSKLPRGHFQGIAFHNSFDSPFADVIEISVRGGRRITIHKVTRAIDAGLVVNPDSFDGQHASGLLWGLMQAVYAEHTVKNNTIVESNFNTYKMPRISAMPEFEVHHVQSQNDPTGIGEPVNHTPQAALTNAIFAATGKRIRSLPLKKHGFSLA